MTETRTSTRPDRKENVEFQEEPPTIFCEWKCIFAARIFIIIIWDVCLHKIKQRKSQDTWVTTMTATQWIQINKKLV